TRAKQGDVLRDNFRGVFPAGSRKLSADERLHAEADAVDAGAQPRVDAAGSCGAWRSFDSGFPPRTRQASQKPGEMVRFHRTGSPASEVESVRRPRKGMRGDLFQKRGKIAPLQLTRKHPRGEIAVRALLGTKRP